MRFASVAEVKNQLSSYLARARRRNEPIGVTHHGKPYALIQAIGENEPRGAAMESARASPPGKGVGGR